MNDDAFDAPKTRGTRKSMCWFDGSCAVSRALLLAVLVVAISQSAGADRMGMVR